MSGIDVHQHVWPAELLDALRSRRTPPFLSGWTLHTAGEAPYQVDPRDHDPARRAALDPGRRIALSLSTPIGIEELPADEAVPLLDAWHRGALALGEPYRVWAATSGTDPDLQALCSLLAEPQVVGLQLSAARLGSPAALAAAAPTLALLQSVGKPVLVHPGPVTATAGAPAWWPALVDYPAQLQAAYWAWRAVGRANHPGLRICFVAGAGLAPAQHERFAARAGTPFVLDPDVFVDTSSYRRQGVDALVRAIGIDTVVLGSDRPYAEPCDPGLGAAAWHAISMSNPQRLLTGVWDVQSAAAPSADSTPGRARPAHRTDRLTEGGSS